jgi:flagellin-like hook-associated protein FlgL
MSGIVLSAGVRQNLLSLQNTADLMSLTQNRLATGKKVNTALDNPTNYFTSAALQSRSKDLNALLDSMSNGIKTLEAGDNGITAINRTIESMQSTLRQARQDKSFKSTSYTLDNESIGTAAAKFLTFSGGAVGTTPVGVSLNTADTVAATRSTLTATADYVAPTPATASLVTAAATFTDIDLSNDAGDGLTFDVQLGAVGTVGITLTRADAGPDNIIQIGEAVAAIQTQLNAFGAGAGLGVNVGTDGLGTSLTFTAAVPGATALTVDNIAVVDGGAGGGNLQAITDLGITTPAGQTNTGIAAVNRVITINNGTTTANITLTSANAATAATARAYIAAQLTAQNVTGITVGGIGNRIDLAGLANGSNSIAIGGAGANSVFGAGAVPIIGVPGSGDGSIKAVDTLVSEINANTSLNAYVRASNDNGKLRIENLSTQPLDIVGVSASAGTITGGIGTTGTGTVGGNEVRVNFVKQFNGFIDQLNKLADDASYNGVNLLRGDKLKITFNENGSSTIEIQAKDSSGNPTSINTNTLGITQATSPEFDSDAQIDVRLDVLTNALGALRSQASLFGSNLSVVQNRQDFTKSMMNTLQTGADNLVLADTNEEGANMLALQTRQQLSTTALSLANQASQAVLRLFG